MPAQDTHLRRPPHWLSAALLLGVFCALTAPLIFAGKSGKSEMKDQQLYHLPVIETFAEQLPAPDITSYDSATAPGYHLLMALIHRATGGSLTAMVGITWLFGLGLVLAVAWYAARVAGWARAAVLVMPLAYSSYTVGGATALSTDNMAVMFASLAVGGAVFLTWNVRTSLALGAAALLAVGVRQIFVWSVAPIGLVGLLASPLARFAPSALVKADEPKRWSNLMLGVLAAAIPVVLLAVFVILWGGLVPNSADVEISKHQQGMNPASFAYAFALLGIFAPPFVVLAGVRRADLRCWALPAFALVALASALAVPTSYLFRDRAYGWFWQVLVQRAPDIAERSLVIALFAPIGAVSCALLWCAVRRAGRAREGIILSLTMLGWLVAQSLNSMAWQKYFEQFLLVALAWMAALALSAQKERLPAYRWAPLWMLAGAQFLFSAAKFFKQAFMNS